MGMSTDAILAYGVDLGEDLPDLLATLDEQHEGLDDYLEHLMGIAPYGDPARPDPETRNQIMEGCAVVFITHCSYDYPMQFLAVRGTEKRARRGYSVPMEELDAVVPLEKRAAFIKFCEEHDIELPEGGPQWHLMSVMG